MTDPFRTPEDYEIFLYTLRERYSSVRHSTLSFIRRGHSLARVTGEIHFDHDIRLVILERLVFDRLPLRIDGYGYGKVAARQAVWDTERLKLAEPHLLKRLRRQDLPLQPFQLLVGGDVLHRAPDFHGKASKAHRHLSEKYIPASL